MTTRTGEPEDPRIGEERATCACGELRDDFGACWRCDADPPEPVEGPDATCHYCGAVFAGAGDDCGACPLTGEDLDAYARDRAAADARPATLSFFEQRFLVRS